LCTRSNNNLIGASCNAAESAKSLRQCAAQKIVTGRRRVAERMVTHDTREGRTKSRKDTGVWLAEPIYEIDE
jgi:hypothetical protein